MVTLTRGHPLTQWLSVHTPHHPSVAVEHLPGEGAGGEWEWEERHCSLTMASAVGKGRRSRGLGSFGMRSSGSTCTCGGGGTKGRREGRRKEGRREEAVEEEIMHSSGIVSRCVLPTLILRCRGHRYRSKQRSNLSWMK